MQTPNRPETEENVQGAYFESHENIRIVKKSVTATLQIQLIVRLGCVLTSCDNLRFSWFCVPQKEGNDEIMR